MAERTPGLALNLYVAPAVRVQGQGVWGRWLVAFIFLTVEKDLLRSWCNADLTCFCLEQCLPFLPQVFSG